MMSYSARIARRGGSVAPSPARPQPSAAEPLDMDELKKLRELVADGAECHRLNSWEQNFLADRQAQLERRGDDIALTPAQKAALQRIEEKVYACG